MMLSVDLVGFSDLVSLFGVSRTRAEQIVRTPGFPPASYVGAKRTRVWERDEVLTWATKRGREIHDDRDDDADD